MSAVVSMLDEREACTGCGLRPDQMTLVEADLSSCPGCEARDRAAKSAGKDTSGIQVRFFPVDDTSASVWAKFTKAGAEWAARRRGLPAVVLTEPPNPDDAGG